MPLNRHTARALKVLAFGSERLHLAVRDPPLTRSPGPQPRGGSDRSHPCPLQGGTASYRKSRPQSSCYATMVTGDLLMAKRTNRVAWGLVGLLSAVVLV